MKHLNNGFLCDASNVKWCNTACNVCLYLSIAVQSCKILPKNSNDLLLQDLLISYFKRHEIVYFAISLQEIDYFTNNRMELFYQIWQRFLYISVTYRKVINCIIFFINNFHRHNSLYNDKFCRMYTLLRDNSCWFDSSVGKWALLIFLPVTNWERLILPRCQISGCVRPIGDSAPSWSGISPWLV